MIHSIASSSLKVDDRKQLIAAYEANILFAVGRLCNCFNSIYQGIFFYLLCIRNEMI